MGSNQSVEYWRPVRESNPRGRREREATCCNSKELRGMDSTLPHLKDSWERLLDSQWTRALRVLDSLRLLLHWSLSSGDHRDSVEELQVGRIVFNLLGITRSELPLLRVDFL